jgi:hypothetical protein
LVPSIPIGTVLSLQQSIRGSDFVYDASIDIHCRPLEVGSVPMSIGIVIRVTLRASDLVQVPERRCLHRSIRVPVYEYRAFQLIRSSSGATMVASKGRTGLDRLVQFSLLRASPVADSFVMSQYVAQKAPSQIPVLNAKHIHDSGRISLPNVLRRPLKIIPRHAKRVDQQIQGDQPKPSEEQVGILIHQQPMPIRPPRRVPRQTLPSPKHKLPQETFRGLYELPFPATAL